MRMWHWVLLLLGLLVVAEVVVALTDLPIHVYIQIAVLAAGTAAWLFIGLYATRSPWRTYVAGKALMLVMCAYGLLLGLALTVNLLPGFPLLDEARVAVYTLLVVANVVFLRTLWRVQKRLVQDPMPQVGADPRFPDHP